MSKNSHSKKSDRREFFRGLFRWSGLGTILGGSGYLAIRPGGRVPEETCGHQAICSACGKKDTCGLPAALSRRQQKNFTEGREDAKKKI